MSQPQFNILKYATIYFKLGWNVIPLFNFSKNPASASSILPNGGWLELQNRRITEAEFDLFFNKSKPTGLGVITGKISGIVVLDEDSYKEGGLTVDLKTPLKSKTASGGFHHFFKYVEPIKSTGLKRGIFVETKADGGFVVLPPSYVINKSGSKAGYEWVEARLSSFKDLPTISEGELLKYKSHQSVKTDLHTVIGSSVGDRHNDARTIALMVFNRFKKDEWDLAAEFVRSENKKLKEPLPDRELEQIIKDAAEFVFNNPKEVVEEKGIKKSELVIYSGTEADDLYSKKQELFGKGITTGYVELDKYFKFLPEQVYMLSAATHIGKTTFALNMAAKIANLGHVVLFASLEQGVYVVPRVKSILGDDKMPNNFSIIDTDSFPSASDFINMINKMEKKPEVLFIDHLHYFARGNRGATEEIDRIVVEIQVMAKKLKIPILVISHVRKLNDSKKLPTMDDMKDSVSLSQIPSVVMLLHREKNDPDLMLDSMGIYSNEGFLLINKNRIQGKTGILKLVFFDSGVINFV